MTTAISRRPSVPTASRTAPAGDDYKWIAAGVVMVGMIMSILDATVVNVALNTLQNDFRVSISTIQWVVTGYSLGLAAVIPLSGWLADRFSAKRVFIASEIGFTVASAVCGLSTSANMLIAVRVIQGLAGGLLMPVGMATLMSSSRPDERGRMMAVLGVPTMIAPILGPTLGGWLIQSVSWRLIFYINVPIGIAGTIASVLLLRGHRGRRDVQPLDWVGMLLASPAVVGVVYGLAQPATYGWASVQTLLPLMGGLALLAVFCLYELRQPFPLIEIRVFEDAAFGAAMGLSLIIVVALFGAVLLMPLFLQQVQGYGAQHAGLIVSAQGVGALLVMPISGTLTDRVGAQRVVPVGIAILAGATLWATTIAADTSQLTVMLMLGVRGLGMGFCMMPTFAAAYVSMRPELIARATAVSNTVQRAGGALGVAIVTTILTSLILSNLPPLPAGFSLSNGSSGLAGAHLPHAVKALLLEQVARGYDDTFWIAAGITVLAFPMALLLRRAQRPEAVRAYGMRQLREALLLGVAAHWVDRRRVSGNGSANGSPALPGLSRQALARAGLTRLESARTILRMGTGAAGLLPQAPLSRTYKVLVVAIAVAALAVMVVLVLHGAQKPTVPSLPSLVPPR